MKRGRFQVIMKFISCIISYYSVGRYSGNVAKRDAAEISKLFSQILPASCRLAETSGWGRKELLS
jgi:hypothetical protein